MPRKSHHKLRKYSKAKADPRLEKLVLFVAIVEPFSTIPQIIQIYFAHNNGSSLFTWGMYLLASAIWLVYGIKMRNLPIILTDILWVTVEAIVVIGLMITH